MEISNENEPQNEPKVNTFGSRFQKMREDRKVRFDYTGAYGLQMSPHRGTPRATQNYIKKQKDSRNLFFYGKTTN
jgi:hypothetical protein